VITALWIAGGIVAYVAAACLLGKYMARNGEDYPAMPPEAYPGELAHLRDLLLAVSRLANTDDRVNELLIDHYSDHRIVDAQLTKAGDLDGS
jgi:hypothetical protein